MSIKWDEVNRLLSPIKDYEDLSRRFQSSFAYQFVRETFNFPIPQLIDHTQQLLGGDARGRYADYLAQLVSVLTAIEHAGVIDMLDLVSRTKTRPDLESFTERSGISPQDIVHLLKYLVYWFLPGEKYLSGLVRPSSDLRAAIQLLGEFGIRTNLQLLQLGLTPAARQELAQSCQLPHNTVDILVNIADLSRLPWSSKATIANIIGAGYPTLSALAHADPEQLYEDFFAYGKAIGKNLKLGNEIENSYRIAKIVPSILHMDQQ